MVSEIVKCIVSIFITLPMQSLWEANCVHPEAVYCCFTRTTLFTELFKCFYNQSYRLLSCRQVLLLYTQLTFGYRIKLLIEYYRSWSL